jgi:hypothetical protein
MSRPVFIVDRWLCRCTPVVSSRYMLHGPACDRPHHQRRPLRLTRVSRQSRDHEVTTTSTRPVVRLRTHGTE